MADGVGKCEGSVRLLVTRVYAGVSQRLLGKLKIAHEREGCSKSTMLDLRLRIRDRAIGVRRHREQVWQDLVDPGRWCRADAALHAVAQGNCEAAILLFLCSKYPDFARSGSPRRSMVVSVAATAQQWIVVRAEAGNCDWKAVDVQTKVYSTALLMRS